MLAHLLPTLLGVGLLAVVATAVLAAFHVPRFHTPLLAIVRGAVQLAVISVVLSGVITNPVWIGVALAVMFTIAAVVSARRAGWSRHAFLVAATSIGAGVLVAGSVIFLSGALEPTARYLLALGAIIIGSTMSISTLTARRFTTGVVEHWDEVEGWLALGAPPRAATLALARDAVHEALIPSIDQTKTTGLVVLPGAFVGAIFGGLSPLEAGRFQIVVLAAIMAAGAITAVLTVQWMGAVRTKPRALA